MTRILASDKPLHMVWLATNACDARCQHCSSSSTRRTPDELTTDEALRMVDELAAAGVIDLAISGGEPLLRRDIFRVISRARAHGITVGVGSNGAHLSPAVATRLLATGVNRVQISLDGKAAAHDALRCWPGLFDRAVQSIQHVAAAGLRVHICCTINRLNATDLDRFTSFVTTLPVARINFSRFVPTGRGTDGLDLADEKWRAVTEDVARLRAAHAAQLEITTHLAQEVLVEPALVDMPAFVGCQAGRAQGCITANGQVLPCVLLPVPVGSIRERPFETIWREAPLLIALRDRSSLRGRCKACLVQAKCGGCRAVAFARTGDVFAEDPRCWLSPAAHHQCERS